MTEINIVKYFLYARYCIKIYFITRRFLQNFDSRNHGLKKDMDRAQYLTFDLSCTTKY